MRDFALRCIKAAGALVGIAALYSVAFLIAGCNGGDPTNVCIRRDDITGICLERGFPTPPPIDPCQWSVTCDPVSGFAGVYRCTANPEGPTLYYVGATGVGDPSGILVAKSGDNVTACRVPCGCLPPLALR